MMLLMLIWWAALGAGVGALACSPQFLAGFDEAARGKQGDPDAEETEGADAEPDDGFEPIGPELEQPRRVMALCAVAGVAGGLVSLLFFTGAGLLWTLGSGVALVASLTAAWWLQVRRLADAPTRAREADEPGEGR